MPYGKCIDYSYRNILKGKKLVLIEQSDEETRISAGYIHQISSADCIYKDYKNSNDRFRIEFKALLLCKDYEKIIDHATNEIESFIKKASSENSLQ